MFPEFKAAQQAMVYLAFAYEAAKFDNEREALLADVIRIRVLKSDWFRDVATARAADRSPIFWVALPCIE